MEHNNLGTESLPTNKVPVNNTLHVPVENPGKHLVKLGECNFAVQMTDKGNVIILSDRTDHAVAVNKKNFEIAKVQFNEDGEVTLVDNAQVLNGNLVDVDEDAGKIEFDFGYKRGRYSLIAVYKEDKKGSEVVVESINEEIQKVVAKTEKVSELLQSGDSQYGIDIRNGVLRECLSIHTDNYGAYLTNVSDTPGQTTYMLEVLRPLTSEEATAETATPREDRRITGPITITVTDSVSEGIKLITADSLKQGKHQQVMISNHGKKIELNGEITNDAMDFTISVAVDGTINIVSNTELRTFHHAKSAMESTVLRGEKENDTQSIIQPPTEPPTQPQIMHTIDKSHVVGESRELTQIGETINVVLQNGVEMLVTIGDDDYHVIQEEGADRLTVTDLQNNQLTQLSPSTDFRVGTTLSSNNGDAKVELKVRTNDNGLPVVSITKLAGIVSYLVADNSPQPQTVDIPTPPEPTLDELQPERVSVDLKANQAQIGIDLSYGIQTLYLGSQNHIIYLRRITDDRYSIQIRDESDATKKHTYYVAEITVSRDRNGKPILCNLGDSTEALFVNVNTIDIKFHDLDFSLCLADDGTWEIEANCDLKTIYYFAPNTPKSEVCDLRTPNDLDAKLADGEPVSDYNPSSYLPRGDQKNPLVRDKTYCELTMGNNTDETAKTRMEAAYQSIKLHLTRLKVESPSEDDVLGWGRILADIDKNDNASKVNYLADVLGLNNRKKSLINELNIISSNVSIYYQAHQNNIKHAKGQIAASEEIVARWEHQVSYLFKILGATQIVEPTELVKFAEFVADKAKSQTEVELHETIKNHLGIKEPKMNTLAKMWRSLFPSKAKQAEANNIKLLQHKLNSILQMTSQLEKNRDYIRKTELNSIKPVFEFMGKVSSTNFDKVIKMANENYGFAVLNKKFGDPSDPTYAKIANDLRTMEMGFPDEFPATTRDGIDVKIVYSKFETPILVVEDF